MRKNKRKPIFFIPQKMAIFARDKILKQTKFVKYFMDNWGRLLVITS